MKKVLIVDDCDSEGGAIWDKLIYEVIAKLKSLPCSYNGSKPCGEWILAHSMYSMSPPVRAYQNFGVLHIPDENQIPAVIVVNEDGTNDAKYNVTAEQAGDFINSRI